MPQHFGDARDWFFEKRFGLFLHWGIYALKGWHEQDQFRRRIPYAEYTGQLAEFNPVRFNPDAWLDLAEGTGMQYVCFTTKHVDGFCMWNTAQTKYNVMNTAYGRDVLGMLAEACHRRGVPLCLYYSVADMHHPNYPNIGRSYERLDPAPGDAPDTARYLEFVRAQIRELCTQYGQIHGLWWDANVINHRDPSFNAMIRQLQPAAVINGRGFDDGDFNTPEREYDKSVADLPAFTRPTEACQAVGVESWGYRENEDYYSDAHLIRSIDTVMAKGGNYLLNVGPKADGTIAEDNAALLRRIGAWYQQVKEAFGDAEPASQLPANRRVLVTRRGQALYVHLTQEPLANTVLLKPFAIRPRSAVLLNTGEPVETGIDMLPELFPDSRTWLRLRNLPVNRLAGTVLVVKLEFDAL